MQGKGTRWAHDDVNETRVCEDFLSTFSWNMASTSITFLIVLSCIRWMDIKGMARLAGGVETREGRKQDKLWIFHTGKRIWEMKLVSTSGLLDLFWNGAKKENGKGFFGYSVSWVRSTIAQRVWGAPCSYSLPPRLASGWMKQHCPAAASCRLL